MLGAKAKAMKILKIYSGRGDSNGSNELLYTRNGGDLVHKNAKYAMLTPCCHFWNWPTPANDGSGLGCQPESRNRKMFPP